jgi:hypothetical protein
MFNFVCKENNFSVGYFKCHVTNKFEISTWLTTLFYHCYTIFIQVLEYVIIHEWEGNQEFLSVRLFVLMFLPSRHLKESFFEVTFVTFLATRACFQYIVIN